MPRGGARYDKDGKLLTIRKPSPNKKKQYATRFRPDTIDFLRRLKNAAKWLEELIDKQRGI